LIDILIEDVEELPETDEPNMVPRFDHLALMLRDQERKPVLAQLTANISIAA